MSKIGGQKGATLADVRVAGKRSSAGRFVNSNRKGRAGTAAQILNPTFNGRIRDQAGTELVALTPIATAGYFSGAGVRAYAALGTWPDGVTVGAADGQITGTPTTPGTYRHLRIGMTVDANPHQAQSNEFSFTIEAAP